MAAKKTTKKAAAEKEPVSGDLGTVVTYHDEISGEPRDARVAGVKNGNVRDLAIFSRAGGTAIPRADCPQGSGPGQWEPKETA